MQKKQKSINNKIDFFDDIFNKAKLTKEIIIKK